MVKKVPLLWKNQRISDTMNSVYQKALKALNNHQVIAFPTETVYGLGVFYDDEKAYELLNHIKQRREDKPYTLMLSDVEEISKYAEIDKRYLPIIKKFMPGSLTVLLKSKDNVPNYVTHNTGTIGVRIPSNKEALELLRFVKKPLLVPSANKADQKPALTAQEVKDIFQNEVNVIIEGDISGGLPSTIIDLTKEEIRLVRPGPISLEEIENRLK